MTFTVAYSAVRDDVKVAVEQELGISSEDTAGLTIAFIQATEPTHVGPALWIDTSQTFFTLKIQTGV